MGAQSKFWRECAKRSLKGTVSFANDWQWIFGSPAVAFGIAAYVASSKSESVSTSTGSPIADAFLVALAAFVVTWLVAFLINLARAPAQIAEEAKKKIEEFENARRTQVIIKSIYFDPNGPTEFRVDLEISNPAYDTTFKNWLLTVTREEQMLITVAPRLVYGGRLLPDMLNPKAVVTDDLSTYPLESGGHRDACLTFTIIAEKRQTIEKSGAQFSLSVTDVQGHTLKAEHLLP